MKSSFEMPETVKHPIKRFGKHVDVVGSDPRTAAANRAPRKVYALVTGLSLIAGLGIVAKASDVIEHGMKRGLIDETVADINNVFFNGRENLTPSSEINTPTDVTIVSSPDKVPAPDQTYFPVVDSCIEVVLNTVDSETDYVYNMVRDANPGLVGEEVMHIVDNQFADANPGIDADRPGVGTDLYIPAGCQSAVGP